MTFCPSFISMLSKCKVDKDSLLHNEQTRLLHEGARQKYIYLCFICQPSWKKSLMQHESGNKIELPSLFMENSLSFMKQCNEKTDKLSLVKYIICVMSEIRITGKKQVFYHPARSSDFCIMEACIVFFDFVFRKHKYNVRDFSKCLCPFQMVSIVRWHVSGFPIVMQQNRHTQDLRKALRGTVGVLYRELWNFKKDFVEIQRGFREDGNVECAACVHEKNGITAMRIQNTSWRSNVHEHIPTLHSMPFASIPACVAQEAPHSHVASRNIPIHNTAGSQVHSEHKIRAPTPLPLTGPLVCPGLHTRGFPPAITIPPPTRGLVQEDDGVAGEGGCKLSFSSTPLPETRKSDQEPCCPAKMLETVRKDSTVQKMGIGTPKDITAQLKSKKKISYDMCFVEKWDRIWSRIEHRQDDTTQDNMSMDCAKHTRTRLICMRHLKTSVLAYSFYRDISKRFPVLMRERNIKRYYHRLLQTY